ncbi:HGGxSTG domain-containing protein [Rhizorhabdus wittichii]|uniref:HGGxSTG domain-containing protein n=1 Tax=Rhizorhabdus wittichii TaxID=160791 RepID=UPI0038572BBD
MPAMKNGRCRLHGGLSTGAPKGNQNALKHGAYTREALSGRAQAAAITRAWRDLLESLE